MGLQVGNFGVLVQGVGLDVQPGAVDVSGADIHTGIQALLADDGQKDALAPVVPVDLVSRLQAHAGDEGPEAGFFSGGYGIGHSLPLGFGRVHKGRVVLAVGLHFSFLGRGQTVIAVLGLEQKGFAQGFVTHDGPPIYN